MFHSNRRTRNETRPQLLVRRYNDYGN